MKNKKKSNVIDFPTSPTKLERQVEAILFAASEPLEIETIEKNSNNKKFKSILINLQSNYKRGINLVCIKISGLLGREDLSKLMALQKSTQKVI